MQTTRSGASTYKSAWAMPKYCTASSQRTMISSSPSFTRSSNRSISRCDDPSSLSIRSLRGIRNCCSVYSLDSNPIGSLWIGFRGSVLFENDDAAHPRDDVPLERAKHTQRQRHRQVHRDSPVADRPWKVQIAEASVRPSMKLRYSHSFPTLMPLAVGFPSLSRNRNLAIDGNARHKAPCGGPIS